MGARAINVPRLLAIESGAVGRLAGMLVDEFDTRRVVVVTGAEVSRGIGESLVTALSSQADAGIRSDLPGSLDGAADLLRELDESPATLLIAVGGGRTIDVAKLAACRARVDLVAVPTVLSHDGMASPVASLTASDGRRRSIGALMPTGVVIDLDVVAAAPDRYVRAGIGDLVGNLTAVADWRQAHSGADEPFDEFAASIATSGARAVLDAEWPLRPDDLAEVARGLVMGGLAMEIAGSSRPCSGAEHLISHALDEIRGHGAALHGEHVAVGVLIASVLQGSVHTDRIRGLFERVGLPVSAVGWGLDESLLVEAVQLAPSTRPNRQTVLGSVDLSDENIRSVVRKALA